MASSSSSSAPSFDVFLSSAEDAREVLASRLYSSCLRRGISIYLSGAEDSSLVSKFVDTRRYIEGSKVAVVVVSESYLTSAWCLDELQTILSIQDQCRLAVLPVFYKVNTSDIRNQSGTVEEPFNNLRERFPEEFQAWRIAIVSLANKAGLYFFNDLSNGNVKTITNKVQAILFDLGIRPNKSLKLTDPLTPQVSVQLVGLDRHMKALYKLLDLNKSNEEVRLIGIWGPGGVGKTTVARFAYEDMYNNFQTHMFVDNAENIYYQDPVTTQTEKTLTSGVQEGSQNKTSGQVSNAVIKSTMGHRKSLLVIDCVDNLEQLKTVVEIVGWCGSGSRVIVITQNKNLLDQFGVEHVYEVESLRYDEALQLFSLSAFEREYPPASFKSLSLRAVQIASFLPLTLKILGSFLQNKSEEEWELELQKLEGDRETTTMKIMKKIEDDQIPSFVFK